MAAQDDPDVDFQLTYIVVGKRHNTRKVDQFHPTRDEDKIQWNGTWDPCDLNVKSGLVVDRTITHPLALDFYLQSLNPIVGTGRAAHHFCLTNDMYLSTADLQAVTRNYAYDKGISYCAPA